MVGYQLDDVHQIFTLEKWLVGNHQTSIHLKKLVGFGVPGSNGEFSSPEQRLVHKSP